MPDLERAGTAEEEGGQLRSSAVLPLRCTVSLLSKPTSINNYGCQPPHPSRTTSCTRQRPESGESPHRGPLGRTGCLQRVFGP
jgi:hypothetical protein